MSSVPDTTPAADPLDPIAGRIETRTLRGATVAGLVLTCLAGLLLAWVALWRPLLLAPIGAAIGALFTGGKEASLPLAIASGVPTWLAGLTIGLVDAAVVALLFPAIVRGLGHLESASRFVASMLRVAQRHARRHLPWVHRWGAWGLYAFMLIPFAFNGPPQGIVLGILAGLRPSQVIRAVFGAIVTTTIAWSIVAHYAREWLMRIDPRLPLYIAIGMTIIVLTVAVVGVVRERVAKRSDARSEVREAKDVP